MVHSWEQAVTEPGLVVLTGWLLATERTIPRYLDLYRAQGCDVLWFPVHPMHILLPGTGEVTPYLRLLATDIFSW